MPQSVDFKEVERKTLVDLQRDGLMELVMGFCLAILSLRAVSPAFTLMYLVSPLLIRPLLLFLRNRFTYPRLGYVRPVEGKPREVLGGIATIILIFIAVLAIALFVYGGLSDLGRWLRWTPSLAGVLLGGMFLSFASKSNLARYYVFALTSFFSGVFFSMFNFGSVVTGISLYFLILGGILFVWGVATFLMFLRKYPRLTEEASHVAG